MPTMKEDRRLICSNRILRRIRHNGKSRGLWKYIVVPHAAMHGDIFIC